MASRKARVRAGFTLLELVAVLALMAMLCAVAAVSLKEACRTARAQYAIEQIMHWDRSLRDHARRFEQEAELTIDLDHNLFFETQFHDGKPTSRRLPLGGGVRIERLFVGPDRIASGRANIEFFPDGHSPTYALKLKTADGNVRWLAFAGASGQVDEEPNDKQIEELFRELFPPRSDFN